MKISSTTIVVSVLTSLSLAGTAALAVQGAPATSPMSAGDQPKNLQVLSKGLTTRQVRAVMEEWTGELGVDCGTCHVRDAADPALDASRRYDYADDSKQEKRTARVMYAMTAEINARYVSTVPNSGIPVTCGTCHRGHLSPVPYSSDEESVPAKTGDVGER